MKLLFAFATLILSTAALASGDGGHGENHIPMGVVVSQIANVAILIGIIWYFAGSAIRGYFRAQKADFLEGMESASKALEVAEQRKNEIESRLSKLRSNITVDLDEAKTQAEEDYRIQLANAKNDAQKIESDTHVALESETQKAIEALRVETFNKSAEFAENKMDKEMTADQQKAWNQTFSDRLRQGVH